MESFETILNRMKNTFEEESGFSADDASDIGIRLKVLASEVYAIKSNIDWLKRESFPQTATGSQLEMLAEERGLKRRSAVKAHGKLKFSMDAVSDHDISVPIGTICSTVGLNIVSYITKEEGIIKQGSLSVEVNAEAQEGGAKGNTNSGTIVSLVTPPLGVDSVINEAAFTGGTDTETDEELRSRLMYSYKNISNGTNSAFYKNCALKYEGVNSASVVKKARGVGTVNVYVGGKGKQVNSDTVTAIGNEINNLRELNVDVQVVNATLKTVDVYFKLEVDKDYDKASVKEACKSSIKSYFDSLRVGETVYLAAVADAVYHTDGVKNYQFTTTDTIDVEVPQDQLAVCGTITIIDM